MAVGFASAAPGGAWALEPERDMGSAILNALRQADWLNPERARAWRNVLLIVSVLCAGAWVALARGGVTA